MRNTIQDEFCLSVTLSKKKKLLADMVEYA